MLFLHLSVFTITMAQCQRIDLSLSGMATYQVMLSYLSAEQLSFYQAEAAKPPRVDSRGVPYPPLVVIDLERGLLIFRTTLAICETCEIGEPAPNKTGRLAIYPKDKPTLAEVAQIRAAKASGVTAAAPRPQLAVNPDDAAL